MNIFKRGLIAILAVSITMSFFPDTVSATEYSDATDEVVEEIESEDFAEEYDVVDSEYSSGEEISEEINDQFVFSFRENDNVKFYTKRSSNDRGDEEVKNITFGYETSNYSIYAEVAKGYVLSDFKIYRNGEELVTEPARTPLLSIEPILNVLPSGRRIISVRCSGSGYIIDDATYEIESILMEVEDYDLSIDAKDITNLSVTNNGKEITQDEDGNYITTSEGNTTIKFKTPTGYEPVLYSTKNEVTSYYSNLDFEKDSSGFWTYTYLATENRKLSISTVKVSKVTFHVDKNNEIRLFSMDKDKNCIVNEASMVSIPSSSSTGQPITTVAVNLPEGDYYFAAIGDNGKPSKKIVSSSSSLANPWQPASIDASEGSDEYKSSINDINEMYGVCLFKGNTSINKDVYVGFAPDTKDVLIDNGLKVKYDIGKNEDGTYQYKASTDGKLLTLNAYCNVKFSVINSTEDAVRVYKVVYENTEEGRVESKIEVPVTQEHDPNDYDVITSEYYEIDNITEVQRIEVVRKKCYKVSVTPINSTVTYPGGDYLAEMVKIVEGESIYVETLPYDGYVLQYVSLTGRIEDAIEAEEGTDNIFKITPNSDCSLVVRSVPAPQEFTIVNTTDSEIKILDEKVVYDEENKVYKVPYDAPTVNISVIEDDDENVKLALKNNKNLVTEINESSSKDVEEFSKTEHIFKVYKDTLTDTNTLIISNPTDSDIRELVIKSNDTGMQDIKVMDENGKYVSMSGSPEVTDSITTETYELEYGKTYTVRVTSEDEYYVGKVTTIIGDTTNINKKQSSIASFNISAFSDINMTIEPEAIIKPVIKYIKNGVELATPVAPRSYDSKKAYMQLQDGKYTLNMLEAGSNVKIVSIEQTFFNKEKVLQSDEGLENISLTVDGDQFSLLRGNEGYKYEDTFGVQTLDDIELEFLLDNGNKYELIISRSNPIEGMFVKGIDIYYDTNFPGSKNIKINPTLEEDGYVKVSTSVYGGKNSNINELKYRFVDSNGDTVASDIISAEWQNLARNLKNNTTGNLIIRAGSDIPNDYKKCKMQFYTEYRDYDENDPSIEKYKEKVLATLNFTIIDSSAKNNVINASVLKADDVSVNLLFKGSYNYKACYNKEQYYKIVAEPLSEDHTDAIKSKRTFYVPVARPEYPDDVTDAKIVSINKDFAQNVKFKLSDNDSGDGEACDFKLTVSFVQIKSNAGEGAIGELDGEAFYEGPSLEIMAATKAPLFETKATIKKGVSNVFTGQKDAVIGTVNASKGTTCYEVSVSDITNVDDSEKLNVSVDDNMQILASAGVNTALGAHTISVLPYAKSSMYSQAVNFNVTVVQGINSLKVVPDSTVLYKKQGTAASMSASVVYNNNLIQPKIKAVKYSLVDEDGEAITFEGQTPTIAINEKSGKLSVNASHDIKEGISSFKIKAQAADYSGNTVFAISELIKLTGKKTELGNIKILKLDREIGKYIVIDGIDNSNVCMTDLDGSMAVVFKKNVAGLDSYYAAELSSLVIPVNDYTLKSSNKAIKVTAGIYGFNIECSGIAKGIKLTATSKDGGKDSKTFIVNSAYYVSSDIELDISEGGKALANNSGEAAECGDKQLSFSGTINTPIKLKLKSKEAGEYVNPKSAIDHAVTIKNGKIVYTDKYNGEYTVLVNGKSATITLQNNGIGRNDSGYKKEYVITNNSYVTTAPQAVKVTGTALAGMDNQKILLTVSEGKNYSTSGKRAYISADTAALVKTPDIYNALDKACDQIGTYVEFTDNKLELNLDAKDLAAGSYKETIVFGVYSDGEFIPDSKPVSITIKVVKPTVYKGSFRLTQKLKFIKNKQGVYDNKVVITYTATKLQSLTFDCDTEEEIKVLNSNVSGKENDFNKYYTLKVDDGKYVIALRDGLSDEEIDYIKSRSGEKDRSGYITYTVAYGDDGYGNPYTVETSTVKITVGY